MSRKLEFRIFKPGKQFDTSQRTIALDKLEDYPYKSVALGSTRSNRTGSWRFWRPYYSTKRAPCDGHCPAGNQLVDLIQALREGDWERAATLLRAENPLPAVTARLCHRPCELHCNRRPHEGSVGIHAVERVVAEIQAERMIFPKPEKSRRVLVLGSGPAELAFAHFMDLLGNEVTLWESEGELAGSLRRGARARHLPATILDAELARLFSDRVSLCLNREMPEDLELPELKQEVDAVFGSVDPSKLALWVSRKDLDRTASGSKESSIEMPRRVSDMIGRGKRAALLLDAEWRGLEPAEVLSAIQIGENDEIVSALKYLALLNGERSDRDERLIGVNDIRTDLMDRSKTIEPLPADPMETLVAGKDVSPEELREALEAVRHCYSCGLCDGCDNCWIFCPDACITREGDTYRIDYDYCKGCQLCVAVCPRGVLSTIEDARWNEGS
jgi:Pyruvate/2-oxoacid:ferredoxin oxidoreductase delta subunit